jgi:SAM-dependent methyltransferase
MPRSWSFSREWDAHFDQGLTRTWGWSIEQRLQQFLLEADITAEWCRGKRILDAGCGNGQLTEALTCWGAFVVGLDYSTSVFRAEEARRSSRATFVQGDLQAPPFGLETFDLVISNGVLHHTPNTFRTFSAVSKLVKPGGRFYLWLYRWRTASAVADIPRVVVSRLPSGLQGLAVKAYAATLQGWHWVRGRRVERSWPERVVDAYDSVTPRYRHYHDPFEVSRWFFENGYAPAKLTHWDNAYGFGMVAVKESQPDTPGPNFGKPRLSSR